MGDDRKHTSKSKLNLEQREKLRYSKGKPIVNPALNVGCARMGKECDRKLERPLWKQIIFGTPPKFMRMYGPKSSEIGRQFLPTMAVYGTGALLFTVWLCEWKAVLKYLPYYNGKYKPRE